MNYRNPVRYPAQPTVETRIRQQLSRRRERGLPGGSALWLAAAKIALLIVVIVFFCQLWLNFAVTRGEKTIQAIEAGRHQLREEQIGLLAARANLMSEKQVVKRAGEELALFVPGDDQVFKIR